MALSREEELELEELEKQLPSIMKDYEDLKKQLAPEEEGPETSMLEAGLRGAAQGLTFESADEIAAGLEGLGGLVSGEGFEKAYEKGLKESRAEYKKSEEEYPIASGAGQIAGGLTQGLALSMIPGAPAATAGKTAANLSKLKKLLLPTAGSSAAQNIKTAVRTGAISGGLTELGASEDKGLEDLASGAASGAIVGGVLGTGIEGVKGAAGALGKKISEGIDRGEYPDVLKQLRTSIREGRKGQGFVTPKDKQAVTDEAKVVAQEIVPKISEELENVGELKQLILDNSKTVLIPVEKSVSEMLEQLSTNPYKKAGTIRKQIQKLYLEKRQALNGKPFTPSAAFSLAKDIAELMKDKKLNKSIKSLGFNTAEAIENAIEQEIDPAKAIAALKKDPEALALYSKYIQELTPEQLLGKPLKAGKKLTNSEAQQKAEELRVLFQDVADMVGTEDPNIINEMILKADPTVTSNLNPIKVLNSKIRDALSSREILGLKKGPSFDEKKYRDFEKIFQNILDQSKDTKASLIKKERYKTALGNLKRSFPELGKEIEERVTPVVDKLELKSYLETGSLDASGEKSGIIKSLVGNLGQLGVGAANIGAQTLEAAEKGIAGPLKLGATVPTSTFIRPGVSALTSIKSAVDEIIEVRKFRGSDPGIFKMISEKLENALTEKDPARRAAVINTLMQYSVFRNLLQNKEE